MNSDSLVWGLFHVNLRAVWLPFFPERFFSISYFCRNRSSRAAIQCWMLILAISKVLWAEYVRNLVSKHHSRSSASVKASRPIILKARKLFLCINTWNLPVQTWAFGCIWGSCPSIFLDWICFSLLLLHRPSVTKSVILSAVKGWNSSPTCYFGSILIRLCCPFWCGFQLGKNQLYLSWELPGETHCELSEYLHTVDKHGW